MATRNRGELLFERYLARWDYDDYEHQPAWLNPPKQRDYLIRASLGEVVAEVKSFESRGLFKNLEEGLIAIQEITKTDPGQDIQSSRANERNNRAPAGRRS